MPKRTDIKSVMVIGSGPIVIGQAAEFDYSGTQACRVLREEGIRVILVNSNPATIMTDPEMADATYIEPISTPILEQIIAKERPDALLPTLGGQTALNAAMALGEAGVLKKYNVELIGASLDAIDRGEDRELFKKVVEEAGAESARSDIAHSLEEVDKIAEKFGYPLVVRPSFTMGGLGSGIAHDEDELHRIAGAGIHYSPTDEVLIEEGIEGWKEYELELMRDKKDNVVVVCPIENVDPVGVHTGDSITVAPVFTLTDREYQKLRDIGIAIIRGVGVDTGGCNIQFAVNPDTGRIIVIEMNPRVSRSSALASKATGFPIAKIATKLALGYTLDEIRNDITQSTPASFEPTIDYVVTKVPRFAFEKFPGADPTLTTSMKSVGEAMALAGNFQESLGKAMRSIDKRHMGFNWDGDKPSEDEVSQLLDAIKVPTEHRYLQIQRALWGGATEQQIFDATKIDPWFIRQFELINETALEIKGAEKLSRKLLKKAKLAGLSDLIDRQRITFMSSVPSFWKIAMRPGKPLMFGMLGSVQMVDTVVEIMQSLPGIPLVCDPVLRAGGGGSLGKDDVGYAMRERLLPIAAVATPNLPEARILAELPEGTADECAAKLSAYCQHLLITGGHGDETDIHNRLYVRGGDSHTFTCVRLPGSYHGSGCTLASTLAGRLALGEELVSAVRSALDYTWRTLRDAEQLGHGQYVPRRLPLDLA